MKEQLQLHELCAYLPYDVDIQRSSSNIKRLTLGNAQALLGGTMPGKLILRPLSDLTKEIEHNGERFVPKKQLEKETTTAGTYNWTKITSENIKYVNYEVVQKLLEWHFDIFNLLDRGMAERKGE